MSCDRTLLAQADFDGELDPAQAAEMEAHRRDCADCQETYRQLEQARALMRGAELRMKAPDSLRQALEAKLRAQPQPAVVVKGPGRWWGRTAASFVAGAAIAAGLTLFIAVPSQRGLVDQLVDDHVRSLQPGHLEDVISTDQHTVLPWFDGKLDFAPPVKDLVAKGFPLKGGRLDYLGGRPVAALVYQHGLHAINMFVWPGEAAGGPADASHNGYHLVQWRQGGMTIWAVSDMEAGELAEFATLWKAMP